MSSGYAAPRSLDEALSLLANNVNARILAGGHALLVEPKRSQLAGTLLVDLRKVPGLTGIERDGGGVKIGAMTTLAAIAADATIKQAYAVLAHAANMTGDPQLRNRATLGGSLATTDPEADLPAVAMIYDATIHVTGPKGTRTFGAEDFSAAQSPLRSGEVMTAVTLPALPAGSATAYEAVRNPSTLAPLCAVAVRVTTAGGAVTDSRIAIAGAAERAIRLAEAEKALARQKAGADAAAAAAAATGSVKVRGDLFASTDYRQHLVRVLTERALRAALGVK